APLASSYLASPARVAWRAACARGLLRARASSCWRFSLVDVFAPRAGGAADALDASQSEPSARTQTAEKTRCVARVLPMPGILHTGRQSAAVLRPGSRRAAAVTHLRTVANKPKCKALR